MQKIQTLLLWILCMLPLVMQGQFFDDFSDSNFTQSPVWQGDTGKYIINPNKELQLNDTNIANIDYLSTAASTNDSTVWSFYVKLGFNPSNNNNFRFYLNADRPELIQSLNGYFLQIGENGSLDGIDLYVQTGNTINKIIDGLPGTVSSTPEVWVKVVRDKSGNWEIWADFSGNGNYQSQGTTNNTIHPFGNFIGVYCKHTSSNKDKFFFDSFYVDPLYIDINPPDLVGLQVLSDVKLKVKFNEWLDVQSATNPSNYLIKPSVGNPLNVIIEPLDSSSVILNLGSSLSNGQQYTLLVSNLSDRVGNTLIRDSVMFTYFVPRPNDIVINEIMADPSPSAGLPEVEYVELFNQSGIDINLENWSFSDAGSTVIIPQVEIKNDSFLILCKKGDEILLQPFGKTIGVKGFPAMNNSGDNLTLWDTAGAIINHVKYDGSFYRDDVKNDGGWSLALINPKVDCNKWPNWIASVNSKGGTPGTRNQVSGFEDTINPSLAVLEVILMNKLLISFTEPVDSFLALNPQFYTISPGNIIVQNALPLVGLEQVLITFATDIDTGKIYKISVAQIMDCMGNRIDSTDSMAFIIPEKMNPDDIIINEILFNPSSGGVDFVELYNNSDKIFDLNGLIINELDLTGNVVDNSTIHEWPDLFYPGNYIVLTEDAMQVKLDYYTSNPDAFITVSGFPNFPDDDGHVQIIYDSVIVDELIYSDTWHFELLDDENGVSLERIFFDQKTQDRNNWFSAVSAVGYATPAYLNSQHNQSEPGGQQIEVEPEVFSPDQDGYNDLLFIKYRFAEPGYSGSIFIFDSKGRIVKTIANNELFGLEGQFTWDGIHDDGLKAAIGIYIVYAEVFNLKGNVEHYKIRCVVAGKL